MKEQLNDFLLQMFTSMKAKVSNERGSQTLEWIGIAAVVVILVGIISQAFSGDTTIGESVKNKFNSFISNIGGS